MSGYAVTIEDWVLARRPEGVEIGGCRARVVWVDGEMRVQRYASASSSDGEGWGSPVLASSHKPTQAFVDLIARLPESGALCDSDEARP